MDQSWWMKYQVDIPAGQHGRARVEKVVVSEIDAKWNNLRSLFASGGANAGRGATVGQHTEFYVGHRLWMSDTRAEIIDHMPLFRAVRPGCTVLLHGLGLGMALNGCLLEGASKVTVVERDPDVIALTGSYWREKWGADRVEIIEADALAWNPPNGSHWDVVWHDIWPSICTDNLEEMGVLHRRFARRSGWQGSWCRREVQRIKRREDREDRIWGRR